MRSHQRHGHPKTLSAQLGQELLKVREDNLRSDHGNDKSGGHKRVQECLRALDDKLFVASEIVSTVEEIICTKSWKRTTYIEASLLLDERVDAFSLLAARVHIVEIRVAELNLTWRALSSVLRTIRTNVDDVWSRSEPVLVHIQKTRQIHRRPVSTFIRRGRDARFRRLAGSRQSRRQRR